MKKKLTEAIQLYGEENQLIVALEELAELQKEITKTLRGQGRREAVLEEISDVRIMLEQLIIIGGFSSIELDEELARKYVRLVRRMEEDQHRRK